MFKANKFHMDPVGHRKALLEKHPGSCRFVCNYFLDMRNKIYRLIHRAFRRFCAILTVYFTGSVRILPTIPASRRKRIVDHSPCRSIAECRNKHKEIYLHKGWNTTGCRELMPVGIVTSTLSLFEKEGIRYVRWLKQEAHVLQAWKNVTIRN